MTSPPTRTPRPGIAAGAVSLAASLLAASVLWDWRVAVMFCAVVLAHELGHYVVARAGGLALSAPIVIAPLGGIVLVRFDSGARSERAQASVVAAGPLSGALFATLAACWWLDTGSWMALAFVHVSVVLNLLNLIPAGLLDGGRLSGLAGIPPAFGWLVAVPAAITNPWLLVAIVPAALVGPVSRPPADRAERAIVRRIALGGGLMAAVWLLALQAVLP